jgi:hypothetical protein
VNIIEILEKLGQDAQLRHAPAADLAHALIEAGADETVRAALMGEDRRRLESLLEARHNVCCMIAHPLREDDDELEDDDEGESQDDKDKDKDKGAKSQSFPARRAA